MALRKKEYDFPNAKLVIIGRQCLEFPKWCPMIHVERTRTYFAEALLELRKFRRAKHEAAAGIA